MPTLLLSPRHSEDTRILWRVAVRDGWQVHRVHNWRVPIVPTDDLAICGEPLLTRHIARQLRVKLEEPAAEKAFDSVIYGKHATPLGIRTHDSEDRNLRKSAPSVDPPSALRFLRFLLFKSPFPPPACPPKLQRRRNFQIFFHLS